MTDSAFDPEREPVDVDPEMGHIDPSAAYGGTGRDSRIEPGAEGPAGSGVEGADNAIELERLQEADAAERAEDSADFPDELGEDLGTASEQGNAPGDEMASEGDDPEEIDELTGDDLEVDDLAGEG